MSGTKYTYNAITGKLDKIRAGAVESSGGGNFIQTVSTTDENLTVFPLSKTIETDKNYAFKSTIIGRRTNAPIGDLYHFEIVGNVKNVGGTLTVGNITGTSYELELGTNIDTGHAIGVVANGVKLDFNVEGLAATSIDWKIETIFTEV